MRLLTLFASLLGCVVATCNQEPCSTEEDKVVVLPQSDQVMMMNNIMEQPFGHSFSPKLLRKASIRWGKRATSKTVLPQMLRGSTRFWGKRGDFTESLRRSSIRWGKRSAYEFSSPADLIYPSQLFGQNAIPPLEDVVSESDAVEQEPADIPSEETMQRVAKAGLLRPKLALSSRLWGRRK